MSWRRRKREFFAKLIQVAIGEMLSVANARVTDDPGFGTARPGR